MTDWADFDDFQDALGQEYAERERQYEQDEQTLADRWTDS